ncbi:MAG: hypothetical protein ACPGJS_07680 [Flammeovirgaceae bacterium]
MKHALDIAKYTGSLEELAEDIGNLRYDALEEFLGLLADKLKKDAVADYDRNREKLASKLFHAAELVDDAASEIEEAWVISAPYMNA